MPRKLQENPSGAEHFVAGWNYCQRVVVSVRRGQQSLKKWRPSFLSHPQPNHESDLKQKEDQNLTPAISQAQLRAMPMS
jgi:hypothetical protein